MKKLHSLTPENPTKSYPRWNPFLLLFSLWWFNFSQENKFPLAFSLLSSPLVLFFFGFVLLPFSLLPFLLISRHKNMRWERVELLSRQGQGGALGEIPGPGKRWGHTCNAIKDGRYLYVFGGYGKDNCQTNQVHVFDTGRSLLLLLFFFFFCFCDSFLFSLHFNKWGNFGLILSFMSVMVSCLWFLYTLLRTLCFLWYSVLN